FFGWSALSLHFCRIKENPQLRLGTGFIKGNRVENVISICLQRPRPPEGVVTRSSDKSMESVRTLAGDFKAFVGIQDIYGRIIPQVRWQGAECQLNLQISWQGRESICVPGSLAVLRAHCERAQ